MVILRGLMVDLAPSNNLTFKNSSLFKLLTELKNSAAKKKKKKNPDRKWVLAWKWFGQSIAASPVSDHVSKDSSMKQ